jgi:hypothetical protein
MDERRMQRTREGTGAWLSALSNTLNGTELSSDEFNDNLRIRYGLLDLPEAGPLSK